MDSLWLHEACDVPPGLRAWVTAGGRLLATLHAARIPSELGIEPTPPDDIRDALWQAGPGDARDWGLAGIGAHPLFAGLGHGAITWRPQADEPYRWATYATVRPEAGAVVGVECRRLDLNAGRVVAWEYAVGEGGVLCIGAGVHPEAQDRSHAARLRVLLGNALAGEGIPHRTRSGPAPCWPRPGQRVVRRDLVPIPELPGIVGTWRDLSAAASIPAPPPGGSPACSGRRVACHAGTDGGPGEAWIHPFRVLGRLEVRVGDATPVTTGIRLAVGQGERRSKAGATEVVERWMAALEHPVLYWEVAPSTELPVRIEWDVDLQRAWPYPPGSGGDLELSVAEGGRRAVVRAQGDPFRLFVEVEGGTLEATPTDGPVARFSFRGRGRCRIRLVGASDEADLERSRQMLERRGLPGLLRQRGDHARELATYATSIGAPESALVDSLERAKASMDARLASAPGVGRSLAAFDGRADGRRAWYSGEAACRIGMAQLLIGDRGGPRDTLKFLSLTQDVDGRILEAGSTSGLILSGHTPGIPWFLLLAARYAMWTGELDLLARRWSGIRRALDAGVAARPWERGGEAAALWASALEELQPLAESLGHPELAERLTAHRAAARSAAGSATFGTGPAGLELFSCGEVEQGLERWRALTRLDHDAASPACAMFAIEGLWGARPNALEGALFLSPRFPAAWDSMTLERLRVGRSVLTVRLRRRFGQVAALVERVHGPRMHLEFELHGASANGTVQLDDVELRGGRVAFEAEGRHALTWNS